MARGRGLLLVGAALSLILLGARGGDPPKGKKPPAGKPDDLASRVNAAIDRGAAWLLAEQHEDGSFGRRYRILDAPGIPREALDSIEGQRWGETALALYTLCACGIPRDHPGIVRGFDLIRSQYDARRKAKGGRAFDTYTTSLCLLALDARRHAPVDGGRPARPGGKVPPKAAPAPDADLPWMTELASMLAGAQARSGEFGYQPTPASYAEKAPSPSTYGDHSNTQYALLGLCAARRSGITVDSSVWLRALRRLVECQETDGPAVARGASPPRKGGGNGSEPISTVRDRARGWGYQDGDPATGSMTTGGVSSLAICRAALSGTAEFDAEDDARSEQALFDGLAWLGLHFTLKENPGPADAPMAREQWQYYYLYGLERAGVLGGVERMGGHAWYPEGAGYLMDQQFAEGSWSQRRAGMDFHPPPGPSDPPPGPPGRRPPSKPPVPVPAAPVFSLGNLQDTCFALLFLKRATEGAIATTAAAETLDLSGAAALDPKAFADLLDAVFRRYAAEDDGGRAKRAADFVRLGTGSIPLLLRKLEDEDAAVRGAAGDALRRTTGLTHGFDPAAPGEARAAAIAAWEEWWVGRKGTLVADAGAGVFR